MTDSQPESQIPTAQSSTLKKLAERVSSRKELVETRQSENSLPEDPKVAKVEIGQGVTSKASVSLKPEHTPSTHKQKTASKINVTDERLKKKSSVIIEASVPKSFDGGITSTEPTEPVSDVSRTRSSTTKEKITVSYFSDILPLTVKL